MFVIYTDDGVRPEVVPTGHGTPAYRNSAYWKGEVESTAKAVMATGSHADAIIKAYKKQDVEIVKAPDAPPVPVEPLTPPGFDDPPIPVDGQDVAAEAKPRRGRPPKNTN